MIYLIYPFDQLIDFDYSNQSPIYITYNVALFIIINSNEFRNHFFLVQEEYNKSY